MFSGSSWHHTTSALEYGASSLASVASGNG